MHRKRAIKGQNSYHTTYIRARNTHFSIIYKGNITTKERRNSFYKPEGFMKLQHMIKTDGFIVFWKDNTFRERIGEKLRSWGNMNVLNFWNNWKLYNSHRITKSKCQGCCAKRDSYTPHLQASGQEQHLSHVMRKPVYATCEQQRRRSAAHPRSLISTIVVRCLDSKYL